MSLVRRNSPIHNHVSVRTAGRKAWRVLSGSLVLAMLVTILLYPMAALASPASANPDAPAAMKDAVGSTAYKGKWIDVNLSRQRLTAYVGTKAVYSTLVSTGTRYHPTVTGRFTIRTKLRSQTMSGPGYRLPGVPYVMYFYGGYAIHGTYWHHNFGHPMSHGCVNLPTAAAGWVYGWAPIGTSVYVHY